MAVERWGYAPAAPVEVATGISNGLSLPSYLTQSSAMVPSESWGMSSGPSFNPSQYQVGLPGDWITKDVAPGKYEMFSPDGVSQGFGYKSIDDTLSEYQRQNILGSAREVDGWWLSDYLMEQNSAWDYSTGESVGAVQRDPDSGEYYIADTGGNRTPISQYANKTFGSQDEITAVLEDLYSKAAKPSELFDFEVDYNGTPYKPGGGDLAKWEALGNILAGPEAGKQKTLFGTLVDQKAGSGLDDIGYEGITLSNGEKVLVPMGGVNYASSGSKYEPGASNQLDASSRAWGLPRIYRGYMPTTDRTETITGEQSLYGSKPVFKDGKLAGYQIDTSVLDKKDVDAVNAQNDGGRNKHQATENSYAYNWNRRSSTTLNAVGRQYNIGWGDIAKPMDDTGNVFVGKDDVSRIPGWNNKGSTDYQNWAGGGWLGKNGGLLGTVLMFVPGMQFVGAAISAASALQNDNPLGAALAIAGAGMNLGGVGGGSFAAADAAQLANQGLNVSQIANTIGSGGLMDYATSALAVASKASGIPANVIGGALKGAAVGGLQAGKEGALVGALSGGASAGASNLVDGGVPKLIVSKVVSNLIGMGYSKSQAAEMADKIVKASEQTTQQAPNTTGSTAGRVPVQIEKWGMK